MRTSPWRGQRSCEWQYVLLSTVTKVPKTPPERDAAPLWHLPPLQTVRPMLRKPPKLKTQPHRRAAKTLGRRASYVNIGLGVET